MKESEEEKGKGMERKERSGRGVLGLKGSSEQRTCTYISVNDTLLIILSCPHCIRTCKSSPDCDVHCHVDRAHWNGIDHVHYTLIRLGFPTIACTLYMYM